jgi:hypothetical protein
MIYTGPYVQFLFGQIHYEGKWEGVEPWKSRLFCAQWNGTWAVVFLSGWKGTFSAVGEMPDFQKGDFSAIFSLMLKESASGSSDSCHLNNYQFCTTYRLYPVHKDCARKKQINDAGQISCLKSIKSKGKFTHKAKRIAFDTGLSGASPAISCVFY